MELMDLSDRRIGIVGLGYVGLPLAALCFSKGYSVTGVDFDDKKLGALREGRSYVTGVPDKTVKDMLSSDRVFLTDRYSALVTCDVVLICVSTPLSPRGGVDYSGLMTAIKGLAEQKTLKKQLIIVESTIEPGTTEDKLLPVLAARGKVGKDFYLAFSPERIDPGNKTYGLTNTTKLVSGVTRACLAEAQLIYSRLGIPVHPVSSPAVAELAKLLENLYRDVNIALVNEMAKVCQQGKISIWEVVAAAATKPYGFQSFYPGPGVGGHCIPVDSVYYTSWVKELGLTANLAETARQINSSMPDYVVARLKTILAESGKKIKGSKIFGLGLTYKKDIADCREAPMLNILKMCIQQGAAVSYHDPLIREGVHLPGAVRQEAKAEVLAGQDCVLLGVAHSVYEPQWLAKNCRVLFDLTGVLSGVNNGGNVILL